MQSSGSAGRRPLGEQQAGGARLAGRVLGALETLEQLQNPVDQKQTAAL